MVSGPGFWPTFLYYFSGTGLIIAIVLVQGAHLSARSGLPLQVGLAFGLVAGFLGAYFNRSVMLTLELETVKISPESLKAKLIEIGFHEKTELVDSDCNEQESTWVYERSLLSRLFSGQVYVSQDESAIYVSGRAGVIRSLRKHLPQISSAD